MNTTSVVAVLLLTAGCAEKVTVSAKLQPTVSVKYVGYDPAVTGVEPPPGTQTKPSHVYALVAYSGAKPTLTATLDASRREVTVVVSRAGGSTEGPERQDRLTAPLAIGFDGKAYVLRVIDEQSNELARGEYHALKIPAGPPPR